MAAPVRKFNVQCSTSCTLLGIYISFEEISSQTEAAKQDTTTEELTVSFPSGFLADTNLLLLRHVP